MSIVLKFLIICILLIILYQDFKDRMVYWFLYPCIGLLGALIQLLVFPKEVFFLNTIINLVFIAVILIIGGIYMKLVRRKGFLNESIGSGDILFFIFISFCFPVVSFIVLFVFSLLFSLMIHILIVKESNYKTVPLAGLMALFYSLIYFISFFLEREIIFSY